MLRPTKKQVFQIVSEKAPEYISIFMDFKAYDGGWLEWPDWVIRAKENLKLDYYVLLYKDQKHIDVCLFLFLMGKEGLQEWNQKIESLPEEGKQKYFEELTQEVLDDDLKWLDDRLSVRPTSENEEELKTQFEALSEEEKKEAILNATYLLLHILPSMHNYFALMVCGEKLTSLVPKAINGDDSAFCKAVKIDRNLLFSHPYFIERNKKAQAKGEQDFLESLARYQSTPGLIGKIRYPGLYIIFAMLESLSWLDDFTHTEILDICDAAGLDRWQNRIEDVNAVTKQLARYRRYQKTGGVSMH